MATTIVTGTPVSNLTEAKLDGIGAFDVLMRATKAHLDGEFKQGRITGTEYSTVYLGAMEAAMQTALQFVLQRDKSQAEIALIEAQTSKVQAEQELVERQTLNAIEEGKVLIAQECKLRAEYDVLMQTKLKTSQETELLLWKVNTEKAQTVALGVDPDSVIGKQKLLYQAQATGFERDAEQKAAKLMIDSWNVRRTTDEATVADTTNMLNDAAVGRAVQKLLNGVGA
jgi:hypothetical protein